MTYDKIRGGVYGTAYGDAWGKDTEFYPHWVNLKSNPDFPDPAIITDDTQMSLYTMSALMYETERETELFINIQDSLEKQNLIRKKFMDSFIEWLTDPDNTETRAPGKTCLTAVKNYQLLEERHPEPETLTGKETTHPDSKGCGANMRCGWLGFLPLPEDQLTNLAILQSETTHNHPLALVSSVLTTLTVYDLYHGALKTGDYLEYAIRKLRYLQDDLLVRGNSAAGSFSRNYREGIPEMIDWLTSKTEDVEKYLKADTNTDISVHLGEGWVAEEAYLNALIAAQAHKPGDLQHRRLLQLVQSSGDSDSVAAIGGMFIGTRDGYRQTYPAEWAENLESRYLYELQEMVLYLDRLNTSPTSEDN